MRRRRCGIASANEDKPELAGSEIGRHVVPVHLGVIHGGEGRSQSEIGGDPAVLAGGVEPCPQRIDVPVSLCVRGIVEHLAHDFASDARITAALHFDERRNRLVVKVEMVERHASTRLQLVGDGGLLLDQQPRRVGLARRVPSKDLWVFSDQVLENELGFVLLLRQRDEMAAPS
jgi:hypothetical protein